MTRKLYLNDTYLFESSAIITRASSDEKGFYVLLDQSIFYPQGGGQPSDQGIIKGQGFELQIFRVSQIEDEIRHYINEPNEEILIGSTIFCALDQHRRISNAKYHTSAHLLSNVVEAIYPHIKAIKGHSFPGEAYVEFQGASELPDQAIIGSSLNKAIEDNLGTRIFETDPASFESKFYKLPYEVPSNKAFRVMQIGEHHPIPCGGTHLKSLGKIEKIELSKLKIKNDILRIAYSC